MQTYRALVAWVENRGCSEDTSIYSQNDLIPQYEKGNEHVFAKLFDCKNERSALIHAKAWAYDENFTGADSVLIVYEVKKPHINHQKSHHSKNRLRK